MRLLTSLLVLALAIPSMASAQQVFDYTGHATEYSQAGDQVSMYSVLFETPGFVTPLPLDFDNFEYTLVVEGLNLDSVVGTALSTYNFSGGTITLYEDASTPADYADPSTFTDGTALLIGTINALPITLFTPTLGSSDIGSFDWTGGTNVDDFAPADQLDWVFVVTVSSPTEAGYFQKWDGKVEPREPVVDNDTASWGELKNEF